MRAACHMWSNYSSTDHTPRICLVSYEYAKIARIRCPIPRESMEMLGIIGELLEMVLLHRAQHTQGPTGLKQWSTETPRQRTKRRAFGDRPRRGHALEIVGGTVATSCATCSRHAAALGGRRGPRFAHAPLVLSRDSCTRLSVSSACATTLAAARCLTAIGAETALLSSCCTWKRSGE